MKKTKDVAATAPGAGALVAQAAMALGIALDFEHPADAVLSRFFRENRALGHRDRAFIAEALYSVLRRLRWVRRLAGAGATPRQLLLVWLLRGEGWAMRQFEGIVSSGEKHWIETVKAASLDEGTLAERADLPDWLCERLLATYDEAGLLQLAHSLNRPAPLD
ncbi:MAG: SAM-dependent methyltransferase, partial [Azoarcus sp.]|nr:SAM-dependent methyltransferase [Azoarcus sp.]